MGHLGIWIPGSPATFATKRERSWRQALAKAPPSRLRPAAGFSMEFVLETLAPRGQPIDLDNLCEPVFSVLINKLGSLGGNRSNLQWWQANKSVGSPAGLRISLGRRGMHRWPAGSRVLVADTAYSGTLPEKASDDELPEYLKSVVGCRSVEKGTRFAVALKFASSALNIGQIVTGPVKSLIDCLYPVIGGAAGAPEDWRIDQLAVEKSANELERDTVRIRLWRIRGKEDCRATSPAILGGFFL